MRNLSDWGKVLVSIIVVVGFIGITILYMYRKIETGTVPEILSILLGALSTNFTSVVSYWVGSSSGSSAKDQALAEAARRP